MYYEEREQKIHQALLGTIWEEMHKKKLTKKQLAERLGTSAEYLSKLGARPPHGRSLTPETAKKLMDEMNFLPAQTRKAVDLLTSLEHERSRRQYLIKTHRLDEIRADVFVSLNDEKNPTVLIQLQREKKRHGGSVVSILIPIEDNAMHFFRTEPDGKPEKINVKEADFSLFPEGNLAALLGKTADAMVTEKERVRAEKLELFDGDEMRQLGRIRTGMNKQVSITLGTLDRAIEILGSIFK